jgi:hypothetical protein
LTQKGNEISGTFGKDGQIWGKLDGDTIRFDWAIKGVNGPGKWIMKRESKEISGKWSSTLYSLDGDGDWDIIKLE